MKKWWMKVILAVVLGTGLDIWMMKVPMEGCLPQDISAFAMREWELAVVLWLTSVFLFWWLLYMGVFVPIKRENMMDISVIVIRYMLTAGIFAYGANWILNIYKSMEDCSTMRQTAYLILYMLLLIVCLLLVTDIRKCSGFSGKEALLRLVSYLKKVAIAVGKGIAAVLQMLDRFFQKFRYGMFMLMLAIWSFLIVEIFCMHTIYTLAIDKIIWNLILYLLLEIIIWLPVRNIKWTAIGMTGICSLVGCVNYFVIIFRGNPVAWGDLAQAKTALSVADGYQYTVNANFIIALVMAIGCIVWCALMRVEKQVITPKRRFLQTGIGYLILFGIGIYAVKSGALYKRIEPVTWNLSIQSSTNGYLLSFAADTANGIIQEPENYDVEELKLLAEEKRVDAGQKETSGTDADFPNLIVIMNESFSDLRVLGDIETDQEYLPYFYSLTEDTIYGNLYVSPFGGSTVYSEFEFLTGNSMIHIPSGMIPYTSYIHGEKTPSLAWTLKEQETPYYTIALHPYDKSGYNRVVVYNSFGFDEFITVDDFSDYEIDRKYISDQDDYEKVIEIFEEKKEGQPLFIFNITMQNHGGYGENIYDMNEKVHATDYQGGTDLDEYLSCIKESDTALKYLIDYFDAVEEPTIILMFGDHQPNLSTAFYDYIYDGNADDLTEEEMRQEHIVPFVMWSNVQDFGGEYVEAISTNYLSSLLLNQTGAEQTAYQKFLNELREIYPVISLAGIKSADGTWSTPEAIRETGSKELDIYEQLQYNYLFGKQEQIEAWFYPQTE